MKRAFFSSCMLLVALQSVICVGAAAAPPPEVRRLTPLGAGDSVTIQIAGEPDALNIYVGDDGNINAPLAGPVHVAGLSAVDAAASIAKALKDGGYYINPQVNIVVTQGRSQFVSVIGEVGTIGRYQVDPHTSIVDLLAMAGGVKETASDVVFISRTEANGDVTRIPVNLDGLSKGTQALPSQQLHGGDSLIVPRAEQFYIYGEVKTPGKYRIEQDMTVIQALAHAGGITPAGSERRIQIKRTGKDGKIVTIGANLSDRVQVDDIIRVRESIF